MYIKKILELTSAIGCYSSIWWITIWRTFAAHWNTVSYCQHWKVLSEQLEGFYTFICCCIS